jgi:release factor glutamine methyltransferase
VLALDRSAAALVVARRNARRHGVEGRIDFVQADLLEPVRGPVDAVVSNPPYIRRNELDSLMPDVRDWEPESALFDDEPGAGILGRLIEGAARVLTPGGCFIAEIADARASEALALVEDPGRWSETALAPDLAGLKRVLVTRRGER